MNHSLVSAPYLISYTHGFYRNPDCKCSNRVNIFQKPERKNCIFSMGLNPTKFCAFACRVFDMLGKVCVLLFSGFLDLDRPYCTSSHRVLINPISDFFLEKKVKKFNPISKTLYHCLWNPSDFHKLYCRVVETSVDAANVVGFQVFSAAKIYFVRQNFFWTLSESSSTFDSF